MFVWTCTTNFWQACLNHACKGHWGYFSLKVWKWWRCNFFGKNFPHFLPSEIEKNLHVDRQNAVVTTLPKLSRQTSDNFCSESGNEEKMINFPKNFFVKLFVWTCTITIWQACRTVVAKNTKKFPELQKTWSYNFFQQNSFFHQKRLFSNEECNFDNASKKISLRIHRFAAQIPKTTKKFVNLSEGK